MCISSDKDAISTTDPANIKRFLGKRENKIICITYQSYSTLLDCLGDIQINVCIFDEAHHAVGETYQSLIFDNAVCEKQIFFTATPKNANGIIMYDRDRPDSGMCGKMVYDYSYLRGINEGYLNPVEIRVDMYTENTNKSVYESIARAVLTTGNSRVLTFHSAVNGEGDTSVKRFVDNTEFKRVFKAVQKAEFPQIKTYKTVQMIGLSSKDKPTERTDILAKFDQTADNEVVVIASCQTIGEGVDTKNANMCVFVDPKSSYVQIIQNVGRIVRKVFGESKPNSTVLIPCWVDKTKYLECNGDREKCDDAIRQDMSEGGNFNGILNVLSALKQEDEDLYEICLYYPDTFSPQEIRGNLERHGYTIVDEPGTFEEAAEYLGLEFEEEEDEEYESMEEKIMDMAIQNEVCIEIHTNSLETPVERYNPGCGGDVVRMYRMEEEDTGEDVYCPIVEKATGCRRTRGHMNGPNRENRMRLNVHTNPDIKVLWNITSDVDIGKEICSCVIDCEVIDRWYENLEQLKRFIDENKQRPSQISKNPIEKRLGHWTSSQLQNYKNKKESMKVITKYDLWTVFLEEYKEYFKSDNEVWYETFTQVKTFMNENKKRPSQISKNPIEKRLGSWIYTQQKNYKNKKESMKDESKYNLWTNLLEEYKEYIKDNDGVWYEMFEHVKQFIDENNRKPVISSSNGIEKRLGQWTSSQQDNYKKKEHCMKDTIKYNLWTVFLEEYKEYFKSDDEVWYETFTQVKTFMNENKKRPSDSSTDTIEKRLGKWVSHQQDNYTKREYGMKDEYKYNLWTKILEEYKEYFKSDDDVWYEMFEQLKTFINENKTRPSVSSTDTIKKRLCNWTYAQVQNYKNNNQAMNDETKYNLWTEFLEEYKEYFKSNNEVWYETLEQVKQFICENKRLPTNKDNKILNKWVSHQQDNYKKKEHSMKDTIKYNLWTAFLEEYKENLKSNDDIWYETFEQVKLFMNENKKRPSSSLLNETDEKRLGQWVSHQQDNYKKKEHCMKNESKYNLWTAFLEEYTEYMSPTKTPKKKSMKLNTSSPSTEPKETPEQSRQRVKSVMSELHQQYKTLTSDHLKTLFHTNPNLWYYYHAMSESNEASFPEAEIPRNRIIRALDQIRTKRIKKRVVDMGCGKAQIAQHFQQDPRFEFFNYDHVASNDTVISCDISRTPLEDDSVEICILSLAMWGSNCEQYIQEAARILESGGKLYIIEPTKRWTEKDADTNLIPGTEGNRLKQKIEAAGFRIIQTQIAKFCMFEAVRETPIGNNQYVG